jgi:hypothetical protein
MMLLMLSLVKKQLILSFLSCASVLSLMKVKGKRISDSLVWSFRKILTAGAVHMNMELAITN